MFSEEMWTIFVEADFMRKRESRNNVVLIEYIVMVYSRLILYRRLYNSAVSKRMVCVHLSSAKG